MTQLTDEQIKILADQEIAKWENQKRKQAERLAAQDRERVVVQSADSRGTEKREVMYKNYFRNNVQKDEQGKLRIDGKTVKSVLDFPPEKA